MVWSSVVESALMALWVDAGKAGPSGTLRCWLQFRRRWGDRVRILGLSGSLEFIAAKHRWSAYSGALAMGPGLDLVGCGNMSPGCVGHSPG